MERLTKRCINGIDISNASHKLSGDNKSLFNRPEDYLGIVVSRLADYEDAEEQGLLVKLPCKVGDKCWWISGRDLISGEVDKIEVSDGGVSVIAYGHHGPNYYYHQHGVPYFTRKAAEAALKEMEGNNGTD